MRHRDTDITTNKHMRNNTELREAEKLNLAGWERRWLHLDFV